MVKENQQLLAHFAQEAESKILELEHGEAKILDATFRYLNAGYYGTSDKEFKDESKAELDGNSHGPQFVARKPKRRTVNGRVRRQNVGDYDGSVTDFDYDSEHEFADAFSFEIIHGSPLKKTAVKPSLD